MILFRYAWMVAIVIVVGHALCACLAASPKPFPETWGHLRTTSPGWLQHPSVVLDVAWVRARGTAQVHDGVCVLHMADTSERDLTPAEEQLQACVRAGGLRTDRPTPAGAVRLHWHRVPSRSAVADLREQLQAKLSAENFAGFYYHPVATGPCHVVTIATRTVVGHEIKHCFDGFFHFSDGRWRPRPE